jgi:hypothetical protein
LFDLISLSLSDETRANPAPTQTELRCHPIRGPASIGVRTVVCVAVSVVDQLKLDGPRRFVCNALRVLPSDAISRIVFLSPQSQ